MEEIAVSRVTVSLDVDEPHFFCSFDTSDNYSFLYVGKGGFDLCLDLGKFYIFVENFYCERIEKTSDKIVVSGLIEGNWGKYNDKDDLLKEAV